MDEIKHIRIHNYRGVEDIAFSPKKINIIVGPNNTGKSAILEAVSLLLSSENNFLDIVGNNVFKYLFNIREYDMKYIVREGESKAVIECQIEKTKFKLEFEYRETGIPLDACGAAILSKIRELSNIFLNNPDILKALNMEPISPTKANIIDNTLESELDRILKSGKGDVPHSFEFSLKGQRGSQVRRQKELEDYIQINYERNLKKYLDILENDIFNIYSRCPKVIFTLYKDDVECYYYIDFDFTVDFSLYTGATPESYQRLNILRRFLFQNDRIIIDNREGDTNEFPLLLVSFCSESLVSDINSFYDNIVNEKKIKGVIEYLTERIEYFEDLRKTDDGMRIILKDIKNPLPVSSMGQGLISLIRMILLNSLVSEGVILIEEPESALHPGYIEVFVEEIIGHSNNQLFLTTHSLNLIESILEIGKAKECLDDIQIIRLYNRNDIKGTLSETINGTDALYEIEEIGTDLRGI